MASDALRSLQCFFEASPAARKATRPLGREAEVALVLDGGEKARFTMESGEPRVLPGPARAPDFTLTLPAAAVGRLTGLPGDDVGEFGVAFFGLARSRDPATRVRVHVDASTVQLVRHGYLGVLAAGGAKVAWWLVTNGVRNPKAAIDRLRGAG